MKITFDDTTNETPEYAAFIDKFKPKKTTDDCYTPANIYDVVTLAPDLFESVKAANDVNTKSPVQLPKYEYPDNVIPAAILHKIVQGGVGLTVPRSDAVFIRALDHQRENKKSIFGGGFLLSERAAAERAAAERAAAERVVAERAAALRWRLSEREIEIVRGLAPGGMMGKK